MCILKLELDKWKEKFQDLEARSNERSNKDPVEDTDALTKKLSKLQDELQVVTFLSLPLFWPLYF